MEQSVNSFRKAGLNYINLLFGLNYYLNFNLVCRLTERQESPVAYFCFSARTNATAFDEFIIGTNLMSKVLFLTSEERILSLAIPARNLRARLSAAGKFNLELNPH